MIFLSIKNVVVGTQKLGGALLMNNTTYVLWRTGENYPRNITKYPSLTNPLVNRETCDYFQWHAKFGKVARDKRISNVTFNVFIRV